MQSFGNCIHYLDPGSPSQRKQNWRLMTDLWGREGIASNSVCPSLIQLGFHEADGFIGKCAFNLSSAGRSSVPIHLPCWGEKLQSGSAHVTLQGYLGIWHGGLCDWLLEFVVLQSLKHCKLASKCSLSSSVPSKPYPYHPWNQPWADLLVCGWCQRSDSKQIAYFLLLILLLLLRPPSWTLCKCIFQETNNFPHCWGSTL